MVYLENLGISTCRNKFSSLIHHRFFIIVSCYNGNLNASLGAKLMLRTVTEAKGKGLGSSKKPQFQGSTYIVVTCSCVRLSVFLANW